MASFPNAQNLAAGAIPVWITSGSGSGGGPSGPSEAGASASNSVGTTSAQIVAAGTYHGWLTVQNTHATQTLYVSFGTATTSDFAIAPGAALSLPFGPTNALNGIGSGAGTTFAVVGY